MIGCTMEGYETSGIESVEKMSYDELEYGGVDRHGAL